MNELQALVAMQTPDELAIGRDRAGYVYLIHSDTGHYKIGRSKNVAQRFKVFSFEVPIKLTLTHVFPASDALRAEALLHKRFEVHRVKGEWFSLAMPEVAEIQDIYEYRAGQFFTLSSEGAPQDAILLYSLVVRLRCTPAAEVDWRDSDTKSLAVEECDIYEAFHKATGEGYCGERFESAYHWLTHNDFLGSNHLVTVRHWE